MYKRTVFQKKATDYPFPQADSPVRVLDVLEVVCRGPIDDEGLADIFNLHRRQGTYYATAAAYLGLLRNSGGLWRPTDKGLELNGMGDEQERQRIVGRLVIGLPVFDQAAEHLAILGELPPTEEIADWIRDADRAVNDVTAMRRAKTVSSWVGAVNENTPEIIAELANAPAQAARVA